VVPGGSRGGDQVLACDRGSRPSQQGELMASWIVPPFVTPILSPHKMIMYALYGAHE
jgi:hypothetical protein